MVERNGVLQDHATEALRYALIIEWSDEDQVFIASAPDLPGMRTHGTSRAEALAMREEAIAGWLGAMRQAGRPVPAPRFTALPYPVHPEANPHEIAGARRSA